MGLPGWASMVINDGAGFVKTVVVGITYACLCVYT